MSPVQISAQPGRTYEVVLEQDGARRRFTCEVDDQDAVLNAEPVSELVLAVHRARHGAVQVPGRVLLRLARITALQDETYELMFEAGGTNHRFICEAREHKDISYVTSKPSLTQMNPAHEGPDIGDPRPVVAVVLAMHRARRT